MTIVHASHLPSPLSRQARRSRPATPQFSGKRGPGNRIPAAGFTDGDNDGKTSIALSFYGILKEKSEKNLVGKAPFPARNRPFKEYFGYRLLWELDRRDRSPPISTSRNASTAKSTGKWA